MAATSRDADRSRAMLLRPVTHEHMRKMTEDGKAILVPDKTGRFTLVALPQTRGDKYVY